MNKKIVFLCLLTQLYPVYSLDVERQLHVVTENIFKIQSLCIDLQSIKVSDMQNLNIKTLKILLLETKELLNDLKNTTIRSDSEVHVGAPLMVILYTTIEQILLLDFESQHPYIIDNTFFLINSMPNVLYNLAALFSLFPVEEESGWYPLPKKAVDVSQNLNLNEDYLDEVKKYSHTYVDYMRNMFSDYVFLLSTDTVNKLIDNEKIVLKNLANELINNSIMLYSSIDNNKYEIIHISAPLIYVLHNALIINLSNETNPDKITQNKIEYLFITLALTLKYYPFSKSKSWRASYYNFLY